jgi:two-component system alkaline phosphatase synthesis response regulator PhoP
MTARKVLVADNEIHIVQVVAVKFRNNGFEVITSDNAREAFELACRQKPDVIVTDLQMPGISSLELIENLRNHPATADIPVVLLTARDFTVEDEQMSDLKISVCLAKPFSPRELLQTVNEVLKQHATA